MLRILLERPVTVTMVLLSILVLGGVALCSLPVSLLPDIDAPYITVQSTNAGLTAREIESRVVVPLREELMQISGLEDMVCESRDGAATLKLQFPFGTDMDYLFIEVNEKIDNAMSSLPSMDRPRVYMASAIDIPAFFIDVSMPSGGNFLELSRFCEDVVARRIEQLPEVAMVDVSGCMTEEILIIPKEAILTRMGISISNIESALKKADIQLGSLTVRDGQYHFPLKFEGQVSGVEEIGKIWLRSGNHLMQLKDIADVVCQPAQRIGLVRNSGVQAVSIAVIKQSDARMSRLKKGMGNLMSQFHNDYPNLTFELSRDQTGLLDYSVRSLLLNILAGIFLSSIVIFFFMQDYRNSVLVSVTIPVALVFSLLAFYVLGVSVNILSLSGLLLGLGMMVDNTIVLIDNITGRWQRGDSLRKAVLEGTREVATPMFSSVLTSCAVFIPLVFVNGMAGALFFDEAVAVTTVLLASYLVTIIVIPVYYLWWYEGKSSFSHGPLIKLSFEKKMLRWDQARMKWWLDRSPLSIIMIIISAIGLILLFLKIPKERLPQVTRTDSVLTVDWNAPLTLEENEIRVAQLESVLGPEVLQYNSQVGIQSYVLDHSNHPDITQARIYFSCSDAFILEKTITQLRSFLEDNYPQTLYQFEPAGSVFDMLFADDNSSLVARIRPIKDSELKLTSFLDLLEQIQAILPEGVQTQHVPTQKEVLFVADLEKMGLYGVSYDKLAEALRRALNENYLFRIDQGSHSIPVVLGNNQKRLDEILEKTTIELEDRSIRISELMRQDMAEDFKVLYSGREGSFFPLSLDVQNRDMDCTMKSISKAVLANGNYDVSFSGSWFSSRTLARSMAGVLIIALVLLYLILASQFESILQPFIILLEIVVDLFASIIVLWLMGVSLNMMSLIGLVVVTGIVINDSILKIDTINQLRRSGILLREAILVASSRRFKAILMTSLTTIVAVVPFLFRGSIGADLQYPISLVIIAGMSVGTLVSLFVVPALYYSFYKNER